MSTEQLKFTRREFNTVAGLSAVAVVLSALVPSRVEAATVPSSVAQPSSSFETVHSIMREKSPHMDWSNVVRTVLSPENPNNQDKLAEPVCQAVEIKAASTESQQWCKTEMIGAQVNQEAKGTVYDDGEKINRYTVRDKNPDGTCATNEYFQIDVAVGTQTGGVGATSTNILKQGWFAVGTDGKSTFKDLDFITTAETFRVREAKLKEDGYVRSDYVGKMKFVNFGDTQSGGKTESHPEEGTLAETSECKQEAASVELYNTNLLHHNPQTPQEKHERDLLEAATSHEPIHTDQIATKFPSAITEAIATKGEMDHSVVDSTYSQWRRNMIDDVFMENKGFEDTPSHDHEHYVWLDMVLQKHNMSMKDFLMKYKQLATDRQADFCTADAVDSRKVFEEIFGKGSWDSTRLEYITQVLAPVDTGKHTDLFKGRREKLAQGNSTILAGDQMVGILGKNNFGYYSITLDPTKLYKIRFDSIELMSAGAISGNEAISVQDSTILNNYAVNGKVEFTVWNKDPNEGGTFQVDQIPVGTLSRRAFLPFIRK